MTNDGLLAYKISKKYEVPYILTIRNTDINFTLKYKTFEKNFYKVIMNSRQVIFPNHSYQEKLLVMFKGNSKLK